MRGEVWAKTWASIWALPSQWRPPWLWMARRRSNSSATASAARKTSAPAPGSKSTAMTDAPARRMNAPRARSRATLPVKRSTPMLAMRTPASRHAASIASAWAAFVKSPCTPLSSTVAAPHARRRGRTSARVLNPRKQ